MRLELFFVRTKQVKQRNFIILHIISTLGKEPYKFQLQNATQIIRIILEQ